MQSLRLLVVFWCLISTSISHAELASVTLDQMVEHAEQIPFIPRENALAMNIAYPPIIDLRSQLQKIFPQKLIFLTSWDKKGEAHITTITPPEYSILASKLNLEKINEIAKNLNIQSADVKVLGLGRGQAQLKNKMATTFFIIVESQKLRQIRRAVLTAFVKNGGDAQAFNPDSFYPHITVGYTDRDLHETDGVIKNVENSLDKEFELKLRTTK